MDIKTYNNTNDKENDSMFFGVISSLQLFKDKYLFAGTGNFLSIYNIEQNDKLEKKLKAFNSEKISKINIFLFSDNNNFILTLSGETKIKYSFFNENNIDLNLINISTKSNDYIMNHILHVTSDNSVKKQYLIVGFINNFIEIYKFNNEEKKFEFIKYIFSSVKCIVYSMAFCLYKENNSQDVCDSILIASGTVFRKVIIWKLNFVKDKNDFIKDDNNSITLSGHKGVIFSVHFYSNNTLCSTSDDRITKYWKFDLNNKTYNCDDYIGHSSRVWDSKVFEPQNILVSVSEDATAFVYDLKSKKCIGKLINGHEGWNIRSVEINRDYIWTGGEDGRLLKWKYSKINNDENLQNNDKNDRDKEVISYEIKNEGKQYELACIKQKQKNFKSSIKVVKFLNSNYIIICTNHGQVLAYNIKNKKVDNILYEDNETRVINSLDIIYEYSIIIIGLNDGNIVILYFDNNDINKSIIKSTIVKIFNERITFISHQIIDNNNELFIIISSESSKIKMCVIKNINQMNIVNILEKNNSFLFFCSSLHSQINCFAIKKIENNELYRDKNRYFLFLGDYEGRIYFTQIKKISDQLFLFSNLLKYINIFKKSIITSLIYSLNNIL